MTNKELCKKYYPYCRCMYNPNRKAYAIYMLYARLTPDVGRRHQAWAALAFNLQAQIDSLIEDGSLNEFTKK